MFTITLFGAILLAFDETLLIFNIKIQYTLIVISIVLVQLYKIIGKNQPIQQVNKVNP